MEIALIATEKLPVPAVRGGAIQIYLQSFSPLIAKKHHVTVFSVQDPQLSDRETVDGVDHIHVDQQNFVNEVAAHLKTRHFDVVHVCNRPAWVETFHAVAPKSRFVLSVHNEMFARDKITREKGAKCVSLVDKITTVSDYISYTICERFPEARGKIETVHSGVDLEKYCPAWTDEGHEIKDEMRRQLGLEGKKVILFVGRLSKVKGPHVLLQAIPELIKSHPETVAVFVGSKWFGENDVNKYVKFLYTLAALYPENVQFIKFVRPSDIHKLYSMADVFVCSSQWQEPLARVHYEAMAAGLPILTTARGGNSEVIQVGQNGYVIERFEEPAEYVRHLNRLLSDESHRKELGRAGRALAERRFGWEQVAGKLQRIYEETGSAAEVMSGD
ncbi:MAG TPA: glycosyltransferase family 4 protein [Bacillales bacterium]|nr:glycosyltransferase family 4 protein [Bacillales bacterium]